MNSQSKPSIVFCHGIWADGSCFEKLIPTLQAEGYEVMSAQYGLDSVKSDVEATLRTFSRVSGPILLVGHSYGGSVITYAGTDSRVVVEQAAQHFGIKRDTLRRAVYRGVIPGERIGSGQSMYLVRLEDVERYLATPKRGRKPKAARTSPAP